MTTLNIALHCILLYVQDTLIYFHKACYETILMKYLIELEVSSTAESGFTGSSLTMRSTAMLISFPAEVRATLSVVSVTAGNIPFRIWSSSLECPLAECVYTLSVVPESLQSSVLCPPSNAF